MTSKQNLIAKWLPLKITLSFVRLRTVLERSPFFNSACMMVIVSLLPACVNTIIFRLLLTNIPDDSNEQDKPYSTSDGNSNNGSCA
mmetsp:Transcript_40493/g.84999  ORF Transcript_40493/g.84999 Transcript_40493/m.84999 type:complete len:86 (+) Transcript_40493:152-409(+)